MRDVSITDLYEILCQKFDKEVAKILSTFIEEKISSEVMNSSQKLATKEDVLKLEAKLSETKVDLIKWVFAFFVTLALMVLGLYLK